MLGRHFNPGVIYADDGDWLLVKTRGPVITRGVDEPIVRMTTVDREGTSRRAWVYARRHYRTAQEFPSGEHAVPEPRSHPLPRTAAKPKWEPRARIRPHPELPARRQVAVRVAPARRQMAVREAPARRQMAVRETPARRQKPRPRSPQLKIAAPPSPFLEDACYWLPRDMSGLRPAQDAIVEALSALPWAEASAVRRSSDGAIVEHDVPQGLDALQLAIRVHHTERPSLQQIEAVRRALEPLLARGMVEQSPADRRRYQLHGWECLHSRRRITRRAIEHGGGRAVYATVRFSA